MNSGKEHRATGLVRSAGEFKVKDTDAENSLRVVGIDAQSLPAH